SNDHARPLHVIQAGDFQTWCETQPAATQAWLKAQGFAAAAGTCVLLPGSDGGIAGAVLGIGDPLDAYSYAHAPSALPVGDWRLADFVDAGTRALVQLGWGLGAYRFSRYKSSGRAPARLVVDAVDAEARDLLAACVRVRDLVNTPTEHMGPDELEAVARGIAQAHVASFESIVGDALLEQNFPAIHAVGRASHRAPRLLKLQWGDAAHPHLAIVGKGVC